MEGAEIVSWKVQFSFFNVFFRNAFFLVHCILLDVITRVIFVWIGAYHNFWAQLQTFFSYSCKRNNILTNIISVKWHEVKTCDDSILCIIEIIGGTIIKCMKGEKKTWSQSVPFLTFLFFLYMFYSLKHPSNFHLRCLYIPYCAISRIISFNFSQ